MNFKGHEKRINKIRIVAPLKGTPAEEAGIQAGDIILSIDGVEYSGDQITIATSKMRGEENSKVKLEI